MAGSLQTITGYFWYQCFFNEYSSRRRPKHTAFCTSQTRLKADTREAYARHTAVGHQVVEAPKNMRPSVFQNSRGCKRDRRSYDRSYDVLLFTSPGRKTYDFLSVWVWERGVVSRLTTICDITIFCIALTPFCFSPKNGWKFWKFLKQATQFERAWPDESVHIKNSKSQNSWVTTFCHSGDAVSMIVPHANSMNANRGRGSVNSRKTVSPAKARIKPNWSLIVLETVRAAAEEILLT